jgi:hypothetical protein
MKRFLLLVFGLAVCTPGVHYVAPAGRSLSSDLQVCQLRATRAVPPVRTQVQQDRFLNACMKARGYRVVEG